MGTSQEQGNNSPNMMKQIFALFALVASASAFAPPALNAAKSTALSMNAGQKIAAASAGFIPAILSSTAAVATEGTNEIFGVDDPRLLGVLFAVHWAILGLWYSQYNDVPEEEDFFGEIDYTGVKLGKTKGLYQIDSEDLKSQYGK